MRRRSTVVVALLCAALLPGAVTAAGPSFTPGAPGAGDPYYPLDGNGGYDVKHYDLEPRSTTPATDILRGIGDHLGPRHPEPVELQPRPRRAERPLDQGRRSAGDLDPRRPGTRRSRLATGCASTRSSPSSSSTTASRSQRSNSAQSGFIATDDGAIIAGQPHGAATWFPANDHPIDKASFTYKVTVPKGLQVVANGEADRPPDASRLDHLVLGRQGADGHLPRDGEHRRVRHPRLPQASASATGTPSIRTCSPRSRRRRPVRSSRCRGRADNSYKRLDAHDPHPGRRGDASGSRSRGRRKPTGTSCSSRSTRSARTTGRRCEDVERPHVPGHRVLVPVRGLAGDPPVPGPLPDRQRRRDLRPDRDRPAPGGPRPDGRTDPRSWLVTIPGAGARRRAGHRLRQ